MFFIPVLANEPFRSLLLSDRFMYVVIVEAPYYLYGYMRYSYLTHAICDTFHVILRQPVSRTYVGIRGYDIKRMTNTHVGWN